MKITDIETIVLHLPRKENKADSSQDAVIIRVHTDAGIVGIGETDTHPTIAKAIIEAPFSHSDSQGMRDILIGEDPFNIDKLWKKVYKATAHYGRRGALIQVLGGIDIALWDIVGKATKVPVCKLLGGRFRDTIRAYASALFPQTRQALIEMAQAIVERGFTAVKFGWGGFGKDVSSDMELVAAVRKAVGPDVMLMVDGGECMDVAGATERAKRLEVFDVFWFEDPLRPDDLSSYAKLTRESPVRIAAGEAETTHYPYKDLMEKGGLDIVQPDLARVGGISEAKQIAQMAYDRGVLCVPHCWSTGIVIAATLHFLAAYPQDSFLEFCITDSPLRNDLTVQPMEIDQDGMLAVPDGPGLGIELNEEVMERYRS